MSVLSYWFTAAKRYFVYICSSFGYGKNVQTVNLLLYITLLQLLPEKVATHKQSKDVGAKGSSGMYTLT